MREEDRVELMKRDRRKKRARGIREVVDAMREGGMERGGGAFES